MTDSLSQFRLTSSFSPQPQEEADRLPSRRYEEEEEPENVEEEPEEAVDTAWDAASEGNDRNELSPVDSLQDLQYFPNFYRLLKSLDSGEGLRIPAYPALAHSALFYWSHSSSAQL